jgi:ferric enterobactin receptor
MSNPLLKALLWVAVAWSLVSIASGYLRAQSPLEADAAQTDVDTRFTIRGTVSTADGARLPGAEVRLMNTLISAITDEEGTFTLSDIPAGKHRLRVSFPSFKDSSLEFDAKTAAASGLAIKMEVAPLEFEVTVSPDIPQLMTAAADIGVVEVKPSQIAALPSLGEKDIFRSLQLMPGISATNESSSGLYVRGGTPDQNLVLLDGFTVYNVNHFFGIFSAFNSNAIEDIRMYKGGFDARYGGRLSSVVELTGKGRRSNELTLGGGVSLLSTNGYVDVPIGTRADFMFAGRRSYQSPFSDRIRNTYSDAQTGPGGGGRGFLGFSAQPKSWFYDLNARLTYDLTPSDRLLASFYGGKDSLDNSRDLSFFRPPAGQTDTSEDLAPVEGQITNVSNWSNRGVAATWSRNWTDTFFTKLTFAHSIYRRDYERNADFTSTDDSSTDTDQDSQPIPFGAGSDETNDLTDYTVRFQSFLSLPAAHSLEFGAEGTRFDVNYFFAFQDESGLLDQAHRGSQQALYLQDTWKPFRAFSVTPGVRATYFDITGKTYTDPRLSMIYHINDRLRLKAAGGRYHQFANRLVRENPLSGDQDFWMLSDGELVPVSSATHVIVGGSYETPSLLFDVEAYRKNLSGLSQFAALRPRGPGDYQSPDLSTRFYIGSGRAEGIEFLVQKKAGLNTGWLTYTLGRVRDFFPDILAEPFAASHDATHEIKLVDDLRWRNWNFSGTWVYATGKPYTAPTGLDELTLPDGRTFQFVELGTKNATRLPAYHRLDLSATWNFYTGESNRASAGVSVFNVYNHGNVWRKEYDVYEDQIIETDVNYLGLTISGFVNVDLAIPSALKRIGPIAGTSSPSLTDATGGFTRSKKEKLYDFLGTVESMSKQEIVVDTKWGQKTLQLDDASLTGAPGYDPGTRVHVYYVQRGEGLVVRMVVRKI